MKDVVKNITYGDLWGNSKKDAYKSHKGELCLPRHACTRMPKS
jgi:hypothetical protein